MSRKNSRVETLPSEIYHQAATNLEKLCPVMQNVLRNINFEGKGEQDAQDFADDILLAVLALRYVAESAADKVKIIVTEE